MEYLISILFTLLSLSSFTQTDEVYKLPYESVTKEVLSKEQFFYYEDDYRVYLYFKPTLVRQFYINTLVHGRRVFVKGYRVTEFNNIFEYKKIGIGLVLHIVVNGRTYVVKVDPKP